MDIKTKFNVGGICFFMVNNKIYSSKVERIDISVVSDFSWREKVTINSNPAGSQYRVIFDSDEIFDSKAGVLNSL